VAKLDRLERLTDLVLVLLSARRPLTLEEIAAEVPGYPESREARRQAFERDKRLLRDDGIPLATEPVEGPEQYGYRIHPDAFYLPDLQLQPDEQAALHLAVAGVHLGDPSGRDALLKLGAAGLTEARPLASFVPPPALVALFDAVRSRAEVTFTYRGDERRLAPAGLWFRSGRWYLVGWDLRRDAGRTFRVDRLEGQPVLGPPGSAEVPADFDPEAAVPDEPWRVGEGDEEEVLVRVDAIEAARVAEEVGESAVAEHCPDGSVVLRLGVTSHDALRSYVLGLLDHAEVLAPPGVRAATVAWLEELAAMPSAEPARNALTREDTPAAPVRDTAGPGPPDPSVERRDPSHRLRRLLAIVGWLAQVGEAPIDEVAVRFGLPEDELVHELELAACCGVPPYTPDALMEIVVTDEVVRAFLPEDMARPRRLSPAEGFALAATARTILAVPGADEGGALTRALAKLDAALGEHARLVVDLDEPRFLDVVRQAVDDGTQLAIEYHSASTDETTSRVVDPRRVVSLAGHWYLDAFCHRAGGLRRFRVDRLRSVEPTGKEVQSTGPLPEVTADAFVPGPGSTTVCLRLDPAAAWVVDTVPALSVRDLGRGDQEVCLAVGGLAWLERLLLQLGPHASVTEPAELADAGARAARRVLTLYA